ncbi:MAG: hypothetical protein H6534_09235 [Chthonomonadaceae bacterium]|nr:hypothetical protein [Chthonomonadaceae bacterium]
MRVKLVTTALLVFGIVLLVGWPWIVGAKPAATAPEQERLRYLLRYGIYFVTLLLTFFSTAVGAVLVARQARRQLKEEAMENFHSLLEGTLKDHGQGRNDA